MLKQALFLRMFNEIFSHNEHKDGVVNGISLNVNQSEPNALHENASFLRSETNVINSIIFLDKYILLRSTTD